MTNPQRAVLVMLGGFLAAVLAIDVAPAQVRVGNQSVEDVPQPELRWRPHEWLTEKVGQAIAYDPRRQVVVCFGGTEWINNDTWEWGGSTWRMRRPPHRPPGRSSAAMAYDPVRRTVLLFGGFDYGAKKHLNDTWEWDGSDWRQLRPKTSPPARSWFDMETDDARQQIVLFGGNTGVGSHKNIADTWVWDGSNWQQRTPKTKPKPRSGHALCYNPLTKRVAMFGGYLNWPFAGDNEVYEWDGTDWVHLRPSTKPSYAMTPVFLFDPSINKLIMDRGYSTNETWTWDGKTWARLSPKTRLPYHPWGWAGATDLARKQIVVFGRGDYKDRDAGAETWTYTRGDWQRLQRYTGQPMSFHGTPDVVHDEVRDELVLMGLHDNLTKTPRFEYQMWVLRDDRWLRLRPKTMPPARQGNDFAMVFYEREGKVVLFGGVAPITYKSLRDIWVWDGIDWKEHPLSKAPGQPFVSYPLYDRKRQAVVRYAIDGVDWIWDFRKGWSSKKIKTKPPRNFNGRPEYDRLRNRVVLHTWTRASIPPFDYTGEVWEFDGIDWQKSSIKPPPKLGAVGFSSAVGGLLYLPSNRTGAWGIYDKHCWSYDGKSWRKLPMSIESLRMFRGNAGAWRLKYDANRQRVRGILTQGWVNNDFARHNLLPEVRYPRPGEAAVLDVVYPSKPRQPFWWALSTSNWPGIALRKDPRLGTQMLPLGRSPLLDLTLGAGLVLPLDRQGRAKIRIPIPKSNALVGVRFFAAGVVIGAGGVEEISNSVELEVIR